MELEPVKFYTDAHIPAAVTKALRSKGVDIVRVHEAGLADADDEAHLAFGLAQGRVLVTKDGDFIGFHEDGRTHAGIAFFQQDVGVGYIIGQLLFLHAVMTAEDMRGRLEFM